MSQDHPKPGRPRNRVPVTELDLLTVPQVMAYLRLKGRALSRKKIRSQIVLGLLPAKVDRLCHDRYGQPLYRIERLDVDRWLKASLQPLKVARIA